jgi:hypothetical protein
VAGDSIATAISPRASTSPVAAAARELGQHLQDLPPK